MSLRFKLALLFSLMLMTALFAFGTGMHVAIERMTQESMTRELALEAQRLAENTTAGGSDAFYGREVATDDESAVLLSRVQVFSQDCTISGVISRLRRMITTGRVLPLSDDGLTAMRRGQPWIERSELYSDMHLVYSQPILSNDRVVGVAQVARPTEDQERMLATVRDGMLIGGGGAALLVFGLTWGLAGRALNPLSRLAQDAQSIAIYRDFKRRLKPPSRDDEFNRLAASLNTMLGELQTAYQQVESNLETQRDFVADVSHELRAPLTTVRGNLALLQRDLPMDPDERRAVLRDAVDEIERMSRLVNELLLLARTNNAQPLRLTPVDVVSLADNTRRKATALARGRNIGLHTCAERVMVNGNPDALNQVLLILLDNATKFTPRGGRIALSVETDGSCAHISVQDTGMGIAPEALPHVFERFYRGDSARMGNGNGLGLYIAKSLVEAQGGTISAASSTGEGSSFTVSLPLG